MIASCRFCSSWSVACCNGGFDIGVYMKCALVDVCDWIVDVLVGMSQFNLSHGYEVIVECTLAGAQYRCFEIRLEKCSVAALGWVELHVNLLNISKAFADSG